jgi:DNA repair exonuclease SbcCD ATPase subunit
VIRRICLTNWRAYERAEIPFEDGTTFLVAANGIGKSSLLEAAQFALSGHTASGVSPVTLGSDSAEVEIALQLPGGAVLALRRTIGRDPSVEPTLTVTLNDEVRTAADYLAELDHGFHSNPDFIARNALLRDSLRDVKHTDLRSLLARAFDLDAKRTDAEHLAGLADGHKSTAEQISREIRSEERAIGRLEAETEAAESALADADVALDHARAALESVSRSREAYLEASAVARRVAQWDLDAAEVLAAASHLVPAATLDTMAASIDQFIEEVEAEAAALQETAAALRARVELIDSALSDLAAAGAECPVCRRPLGDLDRATAEAGHRAEADRLRDELNRLELDGARQRVNMARGVARQMIGLGPRPDGPALSELPPDPQGAYDAARTGLERAVTVQQAAAVKARELDSALVAAHEVAERSALSEQAWRRWALTSAASTTLLRSIDDVLDREITPVRRAVERRWNDLFRDRAGLEFDLDGNLWRRVNGERLDVMGFSAGEQTAAKILMQLAILTTATAVDFCWFDEPLEHLDPRTRRHVAGLLAQGRKATGLRQLVVTTYEEELAAQLAEAEESARIEYVRAGPIAEPVD